MTNKDIPVIYIIGPFRSKNGWLIEQNIRRAEEVSLNLWELGFAVICPHTNTRFFNGSLNDSIWLEGDKEILKRCDAAFLISGWEFSTGCNEEVQFCRYIEKPYFNDIKELLKHFHKKE